MGDASTFFELCEDCPTPFNVLLIGFYVEIILAIFLAAGCGSAFWNAIKKCRGIEVDESEPMSCLSREVRTYYSMFQSFRLLIGIVGDALDFYKSTLFDSGWNDYQCMIHVESHSANIKIFVALLLTWLIYSIRNDDASYNKRKNERKHPDFTQWIELCIGGIFWLMLIPPFITHFIPALFVFIWINLLLVCMIGCFGAIITFIFSICGDVGLSIVGCIAAIILPGAIYFVYVYYIDVMITFYYAGGYLSAYNAPYRDRIFTEWIDCLLNKYESRTVAF